MRPPVVARLLFVFVAAVLVSGCAAGPPGGRWDIEPGVQQMFEAGTVLPNHTYYYLGSYAVPDSIIAIDNRFTLRSRVWAWVDMNQELMNGWLQMQRTEHYSPGCEFRGGVILTPDGQRAGVWYSQNIINIIRVPEPGVIEVYQPTTIGRGTCGKTNGAMFSGWAN